MPISEIRAKGDVGGHVLIEQHGVGELVGVFAEAADADLGVQVDVGIVDPEAHGVGGTVLIADDLLDVEVVDPLVLAGVAAQGEPLLQDLPGLLQVLAQGAVEDGGLSGLVPNELAGLGGELHDPALVHDHHALTVVDGDDGPVGDDVVAALGIAALAADPLDALAHEHVLGQGLAVEVLPPLVGEDRGQRCAECLFKTHSFCSPLL